MVNKALDLIQEYIPDRWLNAIATFFATLTFFDIVSLAWKCVTGGITLLFFYLAWLRHKATMEVKRLEKEKLQQEIGDIIQINKKKHG